MGIPRTREGVTWVTGGQSSSVGPPPPKTQRDPTWRNVWSAKHGMQEEWLLGEGDFGELLCPKEGVQRGEKGTGVRGGRAARCKGDKQTQWEGKQPGGL